jgi:two-component system chemotaxis sensor kinase CheA
MFTDEMKEIVESFVVESKEILEKLGNEILEIEKTPEDKELINSIFRAVHTIKGTSGFLSFDQMSLLSHRFEDVLNKLRRGDLKYDPGMLDVMLEAFDLMKVLLKQVIDHDIQEIDLSGTIARLAALSSGSVPVSATPKESEEKQPDQKPPTQTVAVEPSQPEIIIQRDHDETPGHQNVQAQKLDKVADTTIRVDVGRLDHLMNLVGELVLGRNRLSQIVSIAEDHSESDDFTRQLNETSSQIDFITTELQTAVMKTRMVQIGRVFNRFPRLVRDVAREFSKEIDLVIEGEETELDKSIIEEISDPLVHLIRNAVDHGVEPPDVRESLGKPRRGTIHMTAGHEGNHIVIEVRDDGAGIDPEKIRQKALEKGLLTQDEANEMKPEDAYTIIFIPGFTTAQRISSVSGRGVGMDVVKTNVTKLNGTIGVESAVGKGTKFTVKLPLTLAIIQGLLVGVGEETFAIPLSSVLEVVHTPRENVSTVHGRAVIRLRETVLPLVEISEMLQVPGRDASAQSFYTVVVGVGNHKFGIVVDRLVGQKEIVIKPLGAYLKNIPGIAGSTILGDGRVIMILDSGELLRLAQKETSLRTKVSGEMNA